MSARRRKRLLVLQAVSSRKLAFSYLYGYPNAFKRSPLFDATVVDVATHNPFQERFYRWGALIGRTYDAAVMLHSIFSSTLKMPARWRDALHKLGVPIVFFIGNEFYRMPAKMDFAREMDIALLVSQCFSEQVLNLYRDHLGCRVIGLPNTGFDTDRFAPGGPIETRPIDIGYRMMPGLASFGHWEREDIATAVEEAAKGRFVTDISLRVEDRFGPKAWEAFLQNCKTQLSVASGGNIFELDDTTLWRAFNLTQANPNASREEIAAVYPPESERVPLRTLSSRMIEAAATKTPQIMYPEDLGIPLEPDRDYIALEKDHSNLSDVMDRLEDHSFLETIAQNGFDKVKQHTSYDRIFEQFDETLDDLV